LGEGVKLRVVEMIEGSECAPFWLVLGSTSRAHYYSLVGGLYHFYSVTLYCDFMLLSLLFYCYKFSRNFFQNVRKPASCLHHLLPLPRNTSAISRLRSSTPRPRPTSQIKKFASFVNFALNRYQSPL